MATRRSTWTKYSASCAPGMLQRELTTKVGTAVMPEVGRLLEGDGERLDALLVDERLAGGVGVEPATGGAGHQHRRRRRGPRLR